jgi:hypothetical protein
MHSLILLLALILLACVQVHAGDNPRSVRAVRVETAPVLDGFLRDQVWEKALPATGFTQFDPEEGEPASEETEVRVLYDEDALYFGCMFYDSEPDEIVARLTRRDNEVESDLFSILIDSYHDHQTAFEFTFNAAGVEIDILQFDDGEREDLSWDAVWDVETRILGDGWSAEVRIPFRFLRYQVRGEDVAEPVWGINFVREVIRKQEETLWAFTPKSESGFVSRFGHLTGLSDLPTPQYFEVLPFGVQKHRHHPANDTQLEQDGFVSDAGIDVKYGITNNFVLDATINPDFGQVEADPAVLNLTTFETFYPEKRPFFIEGTQIIRFSTFGSEFGPGMFYSRRIGRAISPDELIVPWGGTISSVPQTVSILGAAKISGKTEEGLSLGVLQALTDEETGTVIDSTGQSSDQVIEPFSHYSVVRMRQDILDNSNIGTILTSVAKEGRFPAITTGADWTIRLDTNTYQLSGFLAFSRTTNTLNERINGSAGKVEFSRIAARHWLWSASLDFTSKKYNINDIGFFLRPNDFGPVVTLRYKEDKPSGFYRNYAVRLFLHERRNFDGVNLIRETNLLGQVLFANYWGTAIEGKLDIGKFDDRETRGNGLYQKPHSYSVAASLGTDEREPIVLEGGQFFGWDTKLTRSSRSELEMGIKPLPWMQWNISAGYERVRNLEAWVANVVLETGAGETVSIFADRDTDGYDFTLRSTITFTRDLTLQIYGQVFLARGHYENFRRLVGTSAFVPYTLGDNPDFNEQSFNTNLVLRWEYLPGSTMFLVWSQAREGETDNYFSSFRSNLSDTFAVAPSNVFLLKVSYWLNI